MHDLPAAADRFAKKVFVRRGMNKANPVAVDGAKEHHEAGKLEQRFAFRLRTGTEVQRRGIFEDHEKRDFTFLHKFFSIRFTQSRSDIPIDVTHVIAEFVANDLVELHTAATERGTIFAAQHVFYGMPHAPLELSQKREWTLNGG